MANNGTNGRKEIEALTRDMSTNRDRKSSHLVNLATATLKWLILNSESDDVKFKSATALLELAPVQRKLGMLADTVPMPKLRAYGERIRRLIDAGNADEVLQALERAELASQTEEPAA